MADTSSALSEDDIYRSSTQFKKWSFSRSALAAARKATNESTSKRIKSVLQPDTETLNANEELVLVRFFSNKVIGLAEHLKIPPEVAATAVQFLRRFYILNSCMDYDPKKICTSALFLATKTDNHYMPLRDFADKCDMTQEEIVAPEFRLMQGLQFAFDIRHPRRGLEAGMMQLEDISKGRHVSPSGADPARLQKQMEAICGKDSAKGSRLANLHTAVKVILRNGAILTDAYFLYTPSQIWLAAMHIADSALAKFYLGCALEGLPTELRDAITTTISDCARLMESDQMPAKEERRRISEKLEKCSNPETFDLVKLNAAQKREATDANGNPSKRQKLENGAAAKNDPFGPAIADTK